MRERLAPRLRFGRSSGAFSWLRLSDNLGLDPLRLRASTALLLPALLILAGHLIIAGKLDPPVVLPAGLVEWLDETFRPQVGDLGVKLTGLLLLTGGGLLLAVLVRPAPMSEARVELEERQTAERHPEETQLVAGMLLIGTVLALYAIVQFADGRYDASLVLAWFVGLAIVGAAFYMRDRFAGIDLRPRVEAVDIVFIVLLIVGCAAILFYRLGSVPDSIWPDEGRFWENSRDIALGRWQPKLLEAGTYTFPAPSNYFQAAVIKVFGQSLESWRATSVVAALLALPPAYLLGRHLVGRTLTVAALILLITSPYFIAFARIGYNNAQAIAPVAVGLYLFYVAVQRRSAFLLFLAAASCGLGFYTYQAARLGLLVVVLLLGAGVLTRWLSPRFAAVSGAIVLLVAALVVLPLNLYLRETNPDAVVDKLAEGLYFEVFYGTAHFPEEELAQGPIGIVTLGTHDNARLFFNPEIHGRLIGRGAIRTALTFDDETLVRKHFIPGALGGPAGSILLVAGFATALAAWRSPKGLVLAVWAGVAVILFSVLSSFPPQWTRLVPALPAFALLSSLGLATLLRPFTARMERPLQLGLLFGIVIIFAIAGLRDYFVEMPRQFRPPLTDVIGFEAKAPDPPREVIVLYETQRDLAEPPFLLTSFRPQVRYTPLFAPAEGHRLDDVLAAMPRDDFWLYFDVPSADEALAAAEARFGPGNVILYEDAAKRIIGGSYRPAAGR